MDIRRIQSALYNDGKFMINTHIALPTGEHTNVYLEGNPLAGMKIDDRDGILYAISTFFHGLLWNSNIKAVFYLTKNDAISIAVANQLKVPSFNLYDELLKTATDAGKYAIISTHISKYAVKDINDFIENKIKKQCDFVGCMSSEFDVDIANDVMASSAHTIINLPKTEFFNVKECPMCRMGKPLFVKKEKDDGRPGRGDDRRGGDSSGAGISGKESAGSEQVQSPPQGFERDNTGGKPGARVDGDSIQSNVESTDGGDRLDNVDGDLTITEKRADGDLAEQSGRIHEQGRGNQESNESDLRPESGLSFTDDNGSIDEVEESESGANRATPDEGDLTSGR